ncbi:tripartite tricarboxylate transporter substrate binding protein [Streptomyces jeddahensis]|uniref:Tripartite tricarboxylate transporter family receptor n=1 Tax=Streptomyces jeddahensis TaxID=1716141 RepID=A0A177HT07_9ACTN|nr:tripartite tricarboxylate transporter substrate binding protein [Streptomyces jeddahensis]OAH14005.1 tripartite tricarboxylate transporter family receptor [Streptomyces jeddahensis]
MKSPLRVPLVLTSVAMLVSGCSLMNAKPPVPDDWTPRGSVSALVAFAPGGGSDRSARVIAQGLNELHAGFDVNVENKEGGSGAVGWASFLSEKGNGNALLVAETALNTLPLAYDVPFTYRDFTPLVMFAQDSRMVVARKDAPYDTCADLVEASRKKPVKTGSSGKTGADSLVIAEFKKNGGRFSVVPYGSTGEVLTGLLGGQIDVAPASAAAAKPYLQSGDFKALCTLTDKRYKDPVLGKVPTAKEQGLDAQVTVWRGVLAPGGIAEPQRRYWIKAINKAMKSRTYRDYIKNDLLIPADLSGQKFADYLDAYDRQMKEVYR